MAELPVWQAAEPWQAFPYNGALDYGDFGGTYQPVQFRREGGGAFVRLRGAAKKTTAGAGGQVIGTLPAGYAPVNDLAAVGMFAANSAARIDVKANGDVVIQTAATAGSLITLNFVFALA